MLSLFLAFLAGTVSAAAQGLSVDVELVRTPTSPGAAPGLLGGAMEAGRRGLILGGGYSLHPLVLDSAFLPDVPVVDHRVTGSWSGMVDITDSLSAHMALPVAGQMGGDSPQYSADGFAIGDLALGVRGRILHGRVGSLSLIGEAELPTASEGRWMGGAGAFLVGGGATANGDRSRWDFDLLLELTGIADQTGGLRMGSNIRYALGQRLELGRDWSCLAATHGRIGMVPPGGPGQIGLEWLAGIGRGLGERVQVDGLVGHGMSRGYGATDGRVELRLTGLLDPIPNQAPVPEQPADAIDMTDVPEPEEDLLHVEAGEDVDLLAEDHATQPTEPEAQPAAWVQDDQIAVRYPLRFSVATDVLVPESDQTLDSVAEVLANNPDIVHVIVVGWASSEGHAEINYHLSHRRGLAIVEALIRKGVHPARLSVRAAGESALDEDLLEQRRVELHVMRTSDGEAPPLEPIDRFPWEDAP